MWLYESGDRRRELWDNGTVEYGCKQAWSDPEAGVLPYSKRRHAFA